MFGVFTPGRGDCDCDECMSYANLDLYNPHTPDCEPVILHDVDCNCDDCTQPVDPELEIQGMDFD